MNANPEEMRSLTAPSVAAVRRLLIVDDVLENRDMLGRRLQRRGFEIVQAATGQEALRLVSEERFDTVLLDVMMPEMDGLQVLTAIRRMRSADDLPVIMVTAKSQSIDLADAFALGANDYINKPVDLTIAVSRVNAQIARRDAHLKLESEIRNRTARLVEANRNLQSEVLQRNLADKKIEYLATHDSLTGIPNRASFEFRLRAEWTAARNEDRRIFVLFVDLDGFKGVNDVFGHAVGDELLKIVATNIAAHLDTTDFLGRLGGDEFCIIHTDRHGTRDVESLARRLLDAVGSCRTVSGNSVLIAASIGIAEATDEPDPDTLLRRADLAMYRAKIAGRGLYRIFDHAMDRDLETRRKIEADMRTSLATNGFELHYHAIYNLRDNTLTGFEALCRWPQPDGGYVSPTEFIPLAEETALIIPLGEWVLRQACKDAAAWPGQLRVAVNLSVVQFKSPRLIAAVKEALDESKLDPARLELEITESVLLTDCASNFEVLRQLRELGCRISMDDFGTGYSSLAYLRTFKFDKVKIDRSFLTDLAEKQESQAIVKAVADLGITFGITTTAEGVETRDQLAVLRRDGCSEVQGNIFGAPRPSCELPTLIARIEAGLLP